MTDDERDERMAALDEFAATGGPGQATTVVPLNTTFAPPPSLVHGAQQILVPRNEGKVLQRIATLAAAAGDAWYYRWPVKNHRTGKTDWVEGPSIKLANDVARLYGSCDVDCWVSGEGPDHWEISARFIDLESGYALTRVFRQRKGAGRLHGDNAERNTEIAFAIGVSKAVRNVVVNALQTFADHAVEEARNSLVEKIGKDIERWRERMIERISTIVELPRVEAAIGRSAHDWLAPDIAKVAALGKSIKDGMSTVDETFPPLTPTTTKQDTGDQLDEIANVAKSSGGLGAKPDDQAGADTPAAPAHDEPRRRVIDRFLELASDKRLAPEERLAAIDEAMPQFEDIVDAAFLSGLVKIVARLAKGEIKQATALKELEALS